MDNRRPNGIPEAETKIEEIHGCHSTENSKRGRAGAMTNDNARKAGVVVTFKRLSAPRI